MCPTFHLLLTVVVSTRRECLCYYGLIAFIILWQTLTGLRVCVCVCLAGLCDPYLSCGVFRFRVDCVDPT